MGYVYLAIAIVAEIIGTTTLKAAEQFTKLMPSIIVIISYGLSFYFLGGAMKTIQIGVAYAIWCGVGIVLVNVAVMVFYKQLPDFPSIIGMLFIIVGVIIINLFSQTSGH
jgi:small multidrug resistance pump